MKVATVPGTGTGASLIGDAIFEQSIIKKICNLSYASKRIFSLPTSAKQVL